MVFGELIGRDDVFFQGSRGVRVQRFPVEEIHGASAVHRNRIGLAIDVEVQPTAESANARLSRLVQHGVRPHGKNAFGNDGLFFRFHSQKAVAGFEGFAAAQQRGQAEQPGVRCRPEGDMRR